MIFVSNSVSVSFHLIVSFGAGDLGDGLSVGWGKRGGAEGWTEDCWPSMGLRIWR